VDLDPESDADKPLVAIYTYDAGGERTIKYVPARIDARYSAKEAGSADRLEAMIYPSALLTAKLLPIPEEGFGKGGRRVLKYTKHYYASTSLSTGIGSERIASFLGTKQSVGLYCTSETTLIPPMDAKVLEAGDALGDVFAHFDKTFDLDTPYLYGSGTSVICGPTQITQGFGAYWYHPDHLGSSSYITNLNGEISQHMEYLPFGETLVEEHLNSNNSPFKFNAKEMDAETGNYYYGARYYSPRYNLMLSVDPMSTNAPGWTPYRFAFHNPITFIDPDGLFETKADAQQWAKDNNVKTGLLRNHKIKEQSDGSWSVDNKRDGFTYFKDPSLDDLNVLGRGEDGVIKSALLSNKKYNHFNEMASDAWNSNLARTYVPDFVSLGGGFSGIAGFGGGTSLEANWVLRGSEASFLPIITTTQSIGGGYSIDATLNIGGANYLGQVKDINRMMLQTNIQDGQVSIWASGGLTAGGKIGASGSWSPTVSGHGIIGGQINIGGGLPVGPLPVNGAGGVSNTFIIKDFYKK